MELLTFYKYPLFSSFSFFLSSKVMIHWNPGWLGSRFNTIVINIFVKVSGENERGSFYRNTEVPANYKALYRRYSLPARLRIITVIAIIPSCKQIIGQWSRENCQKNTHFHILLRKTLLRK